RGAGAVGVAFVTRVAPFLGRRAVRGQALGDGLEPQRTFVTYKRPVAGRLRHNKGADFREALKFLRQRGGAGAAGFFSGGDDQHHARRIRKLVGQLQAGDDKGRDPAFHVRRAPAVQFSADNFAGVWIDRPRLGAERNRIEMSGKSDRQFPWSAADARNDLRAAITERKDVDRETSLFQQSGKRFGTGALRTWRVDGVEANEILRQLD